MSTSARPDLGARAEEVLARNRRGAWTCPSGSLYPHQWLWDSCFVAIGLAGSDPRRAAGELQALFRGQWRSGLLPHMLFAPDRKDTGSRRLWQSRKHAGAPRDVQTSCITQPPLAAIAAWRVAEALPADERRAFLLDLLPRLLAYHGWLYRERDPRRRGLVTLIHPWECGLDTTPPWMQELARAPEPWWLRLSIRFHLARLVRFVRRDTRFVPAAERPSDDDGLRMLVLARRAKRDSFDLRRMPPRTSVLIEDVGFNALLVVANQALRQIADALEVTIEPELLGRFGATEVALDDLWDESAGQYFSRNASTDELIPVPTVATFLPLWAGVGSSDQRKRLVALLQDPAEFWPAFPAPSVAMGAPQFDAERYWKGPTWVNMSWALVQGLRVAGEGDVAEELRRRTLDLVERSGFAEYFSPLSGEGFGADDFSWTAALVLDLLGGAAAP